MDNIVVIFEKFGARIIHGTNPADYSHLPNALVNPKFPARVPPHYWKCVDGAIVEMTLKEKELRDATLIGLRSVEQQAINAVVEIKLNWKHYLYVVGVSLVASTAVTFAWLAAIRFL